jgi:hypothetical protein
MLIELIPFLFPTPNSAAMYTALSGDNRYRQLVYNQQPHSNCSSFWQVRIGRILKVYCGASSKKIKAKRLSLFAQRLAV